MINMGDIKTQHQYESEVELRELYKETCLRGEMTQKKAFCSLVFILGFGKTMAKRLISDWKPEPELEEFQDETLVAKKRRLKRQMSLEAKLIAKRYGKKEENTERVCSKCKYYKTCSTWEGEVL